MLIEIKVKTARKTDNKVRKITETYLVDKDFFFEGEYKVSTVLSREREAGLVEGFEIQSLRLSPIKEIATQYSGDVSFIVTLRDTWLDDDGTEKYLRYKVLLWANNLSEANHRVHELAREGYDMLIEGIKQVDYIYIENHEE